MKEERPYRVWLRSRPGMWESYDGYVDIYAQDDTAAGEAARNKLKMGAFPDRPRNSWIVEKIQLRTAEGR